MWPIRTTEKNRVYKAWSSPIGTVKQEFNKVRYMFLRNVGIA